MVRNDAECVRLNEVQRVLLRCCLRASGVNVPKDRFEEFVCSVARAMNTFRIDRSQYCMTDRQVYDAIRDLWMLADQADPPIGQIRARIQDLPERVTRQYDHLASQEIPRFYEADLPSRFGDGEQSTMPEEEATALRDGRFRAWAQIAKPEALIYAIQTLATTGAVIIPGRSRGNGKRSRSTAEPYIGGYARGSGKAMPSGGRPSNLGFKISLIGNLYQSWERITGTEPAAGRGDRTGFGDLVHSVFQWLGIETEAEYASRRFWEKFSKA